MRNDKRIQAVTQAMQLRELNSMSQQLNLNSQALDVMINVRELEATMLRDNLPLDSALFVMQTLQRKVCLVSNQHKQMLGLIEVADLQSAKVLSLASKLGVSRSDLTLAHMMTPVSRLHRVSLDALSRMPISELVMVFEQQGIHHLLVTDIEAEHLCGVITSRNVAGLLGVPMSIYPHAATLSDVIQNVSHPTSA